MTKSKRTIRKGTAADRKRLATARAEEQASKPANVALGRSHRVVLKALKQLQALREEQEVSLSVLEERTGMSRGNLSRLLNNSRPNVTVETLERIASALGAKLRVELDVK